MGNKTGTCDYLGYPVPLLEGEISKQESYLSKGGFLGGKEGSLLEVRLVSEHRGGEDGL